MRLREYKYVYIINFSQDLLAICRELSLEDSLDELMLQLGADSQGRISYDQFLERRLALRPEIDALKSSHTKDNTSDHSQGIIFKIFQFCLFNFKNYGLFIPTNVSYQVLQNNNVDKVFHCNFSSPLDISFDPQI